MKSYRALYVLLLLSIYSAQGFIENNIIKNTRFPYASQITYKSSLKVADIGHALLESNPLERSQECSIMANFLNKCSTDPSLEAEVLSDFGHVLLDIFTFITPEASITQRLLTVIGRLAFIASDYIPDHAIRSDELLFQVSMLLLSTSRLSQCLLPVLKSLLHPIPFRDKRAYILLFRDVGLPWNKYNIVSNALSWVDLPPNTLIPEESFNQGNYLHWVYNGTVKAERCDGAMVNHFTKKSLIGFDKLKECNSHFRTGVSGASLIKLDLEKLQKLMEEDGALNESARNLFFKTLKQAWTLPKNATAL